MNKHIFFALIVLLSSAGCKKFDNINPNVPSEVHPGVILPQVSYNISNTLMEQAFELNNELIQFTCSNNSFTEIQRFKLLPSNSNPIWNGMYNRMRDLNDILRLAGENPDLSNYESVARIIRCFAFSVLTDVYGGVPFQEASKALSDNLVAPAYDGQELIYPALIEELDQAAHSIVPAKGLPLGGDRIFDGNMNKWVRFANSLRLRLLMRVSNVVPDAKNTIKQMLENPGNYPLMEANTDNAAYRYSGNLPDVNPLSRYRDFDFKYKVVSAFMVDSMKKFNDTRLYQYARPTNASVSAGSPEYVGLPNALPITDAANYNGGFDYQSYLGTRFQSATQPSVWMTVSEVQFLKAEAIQRGFALGDAENEYEKGIALSFEWWGAPFDDEYLLQEGVAYDGSLEPIMLQKFFALFFSGMEAWAEYRRTGLPALVPGPANVNDNKIPSRLPYPLEEQSLNAKSYQEAVSELGGDDMNKKLWWQPQ